MLFQTYVYLFPSGILEIRMNHTWQVWCQWHLVTKHRVCVWWCHWCNLTWCVERHNLKKLQLGPLNSFYWSLTDLVTMNCHEMKNNCLKVHQISVQSRNNSIWVWNNTVTANNKTINLILSMGFHHLISVIFFLKGLKAFIRVSQCSSRSGPVLNIRKTPSAEACDQQDIFSARKSHCVQKATASDFELATDIYKKSVKHLIKVRSEPLSFIIKIASALHCK